MTNITAITIIAIIIVALVVIYMQISNIVKLLREFLEIKPDIHKLVKSTAQEEV